MNVYIGKPVVISDMQGPCPNGFHVPTASEWANVVTIGTSLGTWNSSNGTGIKTYLKMPYAGRRDSSTSYQGDYGYYWSCTASTTNAQCLKYSNTDALRIGWERYRGGSIRPFKDSYVAPDSTWTVLYQGTGTAGIYYNSDLGLISLTDGDDYYITMSDKNLGATTVYNSGATLSEANCGKYYQWGNNYGFAWTGSVTTSSTKVNASTYGPGNYYNSSTFIEVSSSPYDWSSVQNDNLRGGVSQGSTTKSVELKNAYIGEYVPPYLCFTANTAGSTVQLTKNGNPTSVTLETSTDGSNWTTYTIGDTITLSNIGNKVYMRNTSETTTGFTIDSSNYYRFDMTGSIAASGDLNYLLNKNSTTTLVGDYCFRNLFSLCTSLTTTPLLPATTLSKGCYYSMFNSCSNLTTLPKLYATTLPDSCYRNMFFSCTNIKLSTTQTGEYQTPYRIPITGTGSVGTYSLYHMFYQTGGTYTSDPSINTTYYTSNTVV